MRDLQAIADRVEIEALRGEWFTERVYEVRYHDTTPLTGSSPQEAGGSDDDNA